MLFYVVLYSPCKLTNDEIIQRAHDQWKDWEANREPKLVQTSWLHTSRSSHEPVLGRLSVGSTPSPPSNSITSRQILAGWPGEGSRLGSCSGSVTWW